MAKFLFFLRNLLFVGAAALGVSYRPAFALAMPEAEEDEEQSRIRWWQRRIAELMAEYFGDDPPIRESGAHRLVPESGRHHLRVPCRDLLAQFGLHP